MATIYTRAAKGSALTWTEGDANITNLNNAKIENVVEDTTPQLGGNLDVNGNSIVSVSNGNISITPNGTGSVIVDGNALPQDQGSADQVLITDGAGQTSWSEVKTIYSLVYNAEASTINKGQPVYLFGANGANPSVKLALNTSDTTSAKTYGVAFENISAGSTGRVITQGVLKNIDTNSFNEGDTLYLGSTAGSLTATKPYAPNHMVYIGIVTVKNSVSGRIVVRIQNGYELDEIHDVQITTTPSNNQVLSYESSSSLWKPRTITEGVTVSDDTTTNATRYVLFDDSTSGTQTALSVSSTKLTFNPSTGTLSATTFSGALSGNATTASTLATARAIYGNNFDGSAALTQIIASTYGGTGNGFTKFSGPTTAEKTFTLPNSNATLLYEGGTIGGTTPAAITGTTITANTQFSGPLNGTVGATTPSTGAFTTLSASSTVSGTGFSTYLASPPAIGGTAAAAGSFTTLSASTSASLKAINEGALYDLGTTGGTIAPNVANGNVQKITLNSALTINAFTSPVAGQSLTLIIYGGTAYTSITSTMKFAGGIKTLTGTASCIDILSVYYDGTNYFASLAKGFA